MSTTDQQPFGAKAIVQFLPAWTVLVSGQLRAGSGVLIEYDPTRLYGEAPPPQAAELPNEVIVHMRVHPGGHESTRRLLQRGGGTDAVALRRSDQWVQELEIPADVTAIELWFEVTGANGGTGWDTRFGANYRFDVLPSAEPATIPAESVAYRWGAIPRLDIVHVVSEHVSKRRTAASPHALSIETHLFVQAWAASHLLPEPRATWLDIHIFDDANELIRSQTLPMTPGGAAESGGEFFVFDRSIYEGSGLMAPGSVARVKAETARKLQYRLYCQAGDQIFTDGLLHQHELVPDATTHQ
jgi:uncharacterized protein DUF6209